VRLHGIAEEDESGLILAAGCRGLRPDMHVIMLTGFLRAHQVVRAIRQYRVADFVEKTPDVHERLLSTIDQILDARHRAERLGQFNLGAVRRLIMDAFSPKDLRRLCEECPDFRPALTSFGSDIGIRDMADILIEYCRTRLLFSELLSQIETRNPRQYAKYRSQLYTGHPQ
jgi:hypothetical protein